VSGNITANVEALAMAGNIRLPEQMLNKDTIADDMYKS
jgi:hypothetical protein